MKTIVVWTLFVIWVEGVTVIDNIATQADCERVAVQLEKSAQVVSAQCFGISKAVQ